MVQTPVLFITFARPDYARRSWDAIKASKPKVLYFYSNKGRREISGEIERNNLIRSFINEIDWDCDLHTWFRENTVGVYESVGGAISWLFENEEKGIVLEEDCVASLAFFDYCDKLLSKFYDNDKIWLISGDNYINYKPDENDYIISRHFQSYGWATWRSRWNKLNWDLTGVEDFIFSKEFRDYWGSHRLAEYRKQKIYKQIPFLERTKCWDGIFYISMEQNHSYCVFPHTHLVTNIGVSGVHNKAIEGIWNTEATPDNEKYCINKEPVSLEPNSNFDDYFYNSVLKSSFGYRVLGHMHFYFLLIRKILLK